MSAFDVIVVGVGAAGSAAAYHLARRGARVLALDRSTIPNDDASHGGITRVIRQAYFEHPDYVPLLLRAYENWRALEREGGERLLFTPGVLYAGSAGSPLIQGCLRSARLHGLVLDQLTESAHAARFGEFTLPPGHVSLFEPAGGYLLAEPSIKAHARLAASHGAMIREREPVRRWGADAREAWAETDRGRFRAGALVLCAGAWMPRIAGLSTPLRVTRQTLVWTKPQRPELFARPDAPVWALMDDDDSMYYGFPAGAGWAGGPGLKAARHFPGPEINPDLADREPSPEQIEQVRGFLRRRLPGADGELLRAQTCLYTTTPDEHFIIDRHPEHERVIVASPCSGHGFKFASVIGEILADLAMTGRSALPVEFLSLARFAVSRRLSV